VGEQSLAGGFVTAVVRAGDTVRRAQPEDAGYVHAVLGWFEREGWDGAPRFLGTDELDREVLSFIDGHVAWDRHSCRRSPQTRAWPGWRGWCGSFMT
jgi:hypothetical protein